MAILYISEYARSGISLNGQALAAGEEPALVTQILGIGTSSITSSSFNVNTKFIRIHADAICSFAIGESPQATTAKARLAANQTEYFSVFPGHKIAVITNT